MHESIKKLGVPGKGYLYSSQKKDTPSQFFQLADQIHMPLVLKITVIMNI